MFYLKLFWINLHGFDCYKQAREANKKKCSRVNSWPNELNYLRWSCKLFNEHIFSIEVFCLMIWSNVFFPVKRMFVTLVSHVATLFSCRFGPLYIWWHTTHYKHTVRITICVVCWWFVFFSFLHHIFSRFRLPDHAVRTVLVKSLMIIVPMVSVYSTTGHRWDFNASFSALGRSVCTYTALYCGLHVYDTRRNVCRHFQLTKLTKYSVRDKRHPVIYPVFVCTRWFAHTIISRDKRFHLPFVCVHIVRRRWKHNEITSAWNVLNAEKLTPNILDVARQYLALDITAVEHLIFNRILQYFPLLCINHGPCIALELLKTFNQN